MCSFPQTEAHSTDLRYRALPWYTLVLTRVVGRLAAGVGRHAARAVHGTWQGQGPQLMLASLGPGGAWGPRNDPLCCVCVCVCTNTVTVTVAADRVRDRLWVWDGSGASERGRARGWVGGSVGEDGIPFVRVLRVQTMRHKMAGTCLMDIVCRSCRSMLLRARSVACVCVCVCVRSFAARRCRLGRS